MDGRYADERDYSRQRDGVNDAFRDKQFDRNAMESDRSYGLQRNGQQFSQFDANRRFGLAQEGQFFDQSMQAATALGGEKQKPFNANQSNNADFANRASGAMQDYDAMLENGYDPLANMRPRNIPGVTTDLERQERAIKDEFIAGVLRAESGAAIGKDEYKRAERMFFPTPLDSPEVAKQKAQARQRAVDGMIGQSQGAYESLYGGGNQPKGDGGTPDGTVIENDNGERRVRRNGKWVPL